MLTIITDVKLRDGAEGEWDSVMRERMACAKGRPGWVGGQLLRSHEDPRARIIVGTWKSRDDWRRWHEDPEFRATREQLDRLVSEPETHRWHEVVLDVSKRAGDGSSN
jgi:heme-degrading monooxygenase HmoA